MPSHITGYNDRISRLCKSSTYFYTSFDLTHSGRCDKYTVHLSFTGHLRITGYNMYACFCCRFFHCSRDFFQFFHRKSLFNDKRAGQIQWFCSHTCKVIYRSTDREFTDISTWKECR